MALLQAARESLDDSLTLRVVADWLEEHGDETDRPRAPSSSRLWFDRAKRPGLVGTVAGAARRAPGRLARADQASGPRGPTKFGAMLAVDLGHDQLLQAEVASARTIRRPGRGWRR